MLATANFKILRRLVRWGLYPVSWLVLLSGFVAIAEDVAAPRNIWMTCIGILALCFFLLEWLVPYERRWAMTRRSFFNDLKFIVINSGVVAGFTALLGLFAISLSTINTGWASNWPMPVQLFVCLLIYEAVNYALHRAMHETGGGLGQFLWRAHSAHHLPPRLYLMMHAVFHPLNGVMIQTVAVILPVWWMGYAPDVVTMFLMIMGLHGLISHFNVDIRMGWANYIFVGPELHRYHHSADAAEAKNYGGTLSIYDLLFGTFVYRTGRPPEHLGVAPDAGLPDYGQTLQVLKLPFTRA